ncbi:PD-(D/E)XK nuclease family protein [Cryobacterium sp. RTS3]|uniref:PD-(D/E)XK nuclease family protein n=1 Tax=Cryobacterium sp. RTS3 TaxID=3048643 RepID=UPI002B23C38C|nr:PD-(D/E)XK nuclease family protein [Cryobacterium sp. RTS3]MEA9998409.1 PD-(D/E)XK nuclease family protein [Cryobacterium sp. RTS3]
MTSLGNPTLDRDVSAPAFPLDDSQRAALDLADGVSAAIIGAPGTGKTTTLIELLADRVLGRGYAPGEVLLLVPTRAGATVLRDRLALRLGVPTNGPLARTANSIAFQLVRGAEAAAGGPTPTLLTGGEQDQIIAELLQGALDDGGPVGDGGDLDTRDRDAGGSFDGGRDRNGGGAGSSGPAWPSTLDPGVRRLRGFRTELRNLMMRAVEYGITPTRLAALGAENDRPEWVAAAHFIHGYDEVKDQSRPGQYDSTELAGFAAAVVAAAAPGSAGSATLGTLAGLRLIVVDDAQELNRATLTLLAQFAARGVAIVAAGDPDITTGSFNGAHADAVGRLGAYLAPGAPFVTTLVLDTVYRHGPGIRGVVREITHRIGTASAGTQRRAASVDPRDGVPAVESGAADSGTADSGTADSGTADPGSEASGAAKSGADAAGTEASASSVETLLAASPADQLALIAGRLRERHVLDRVSWGRMAVVARSGSAIPALARGLAALEVPTQVPSAQTALRDEWAVRAFILALDVTLGRRPLDAEAATELLRGPLGGLDPITLRRLRAALRQQELSQEELSQQELSQHEPGQQELSPKELGQQELSQHEPGQQELSPKELGQQELGQPESGQPGPGEQEPGRPASLATAGAGRTRTADELLAAVFATPSLLSAIDNRTARRAASCAESLLAASVEYEAGATIEELLWGLWQRSGLAREWLEQSTGIGIIADEANHNLDAVVALFSAAQRYVERTPAAPPVLFLEHLVDTDVPEDTLAPRALGDAVTVSTPNGLIGREFDLIVIANVQQNVWPDLRIRGSLLGAGDLAALASGRDPRGGDARTEVLHDELRMFAQAASRARSELLVTAVDNEENEPSVFLKLLPRPTEPAGADAADPAGRYPVSLRGLVGRLRRDLTRGVATGALSGHPDGSGRAADAAATLARLAAAAVPGADPGQWYGLAGPSTVQPLNDPAAGDDPVRVSPSKMAAVETCPLHWAIGRLGGGSSNTAANLGTIIHAVMEESTDRQPDALWQAVDERWGELRFDAEWQSEVQRADARNLTDRLASYLLDFERTGGELLSAEGSFGFDVDGAWLTGTVDRVERLADGSAVIVDLKTGRGDPVSDAGVADHPQLGAYQLAFQEGQIEGVPAGTPLAGARLVIVSSGTVKQNYRNPTQATFTEEQLLAFRTRVGADAALMGGATFVAELATHCLDPRSHGACRIHIIGQVSS